ncbi:hypothetical protein LJY25_18680 [Hymenobacter sp. BT175]|uniref:hypothetical protein n=1 Tax=Hymenobacter translucens TaxID=2886507 RepID=UPI001D0E5EC8|nr:hypothetical protein [Hymenobacter translucens]MCC2548480.1 hypothetical protein [Hymenobacter translucens]
METLLSIPGLQQAHPFHFFDIRAQPTRCDLVVHPAHGWAIATELPAAGRSGILDCAENLAAKICDEYGIAPNELVLVVRYVYPKTDSYFLYRFVHGARDLFGGFTFIGAHREPLDPEYAGQLLERFLLGEKPGPEMRAIQNPVLPHPSRK